MGLGSLATCVLTASLRAPWIQLVMVSLVSVSSLESRIAPGITLAVVKFLAAVSSVQEQK